MSSENQTALEYYKKGALCYHKKDLDGAISNWIEAIRYQPDHVSAIQDLGIAYREKGNADAALKCLNQAIHFAPEKPSIYYNRALVYSDKKDFSQAIADYTQAITINPTYPYAHCNRGGLYLQLGEIEKAIADFKMALQVDPNDELAQKAMKMVNEMPNIEQIFSAAMQEVLNGNLEKGWLILQIAYDRGGKKNCKVHLGFGAVYDKRDAYTKAFAAFDYAISCDPSSPQAYNNRGRMLMSLGEFDAAMEDFKQTIRLEPENARAYFNAGGVYMQRYKFEKAVACFKEAMKLGYAPAQKAMSDAQKQIGKVFPAKTQQTVFNAASPEQMDFVQSILLLSKFVYRYYGPDFRLRPVEKSSFLGLRKQQTTEMDRLWGTTIEDMMEITKDGFNAKHLGATLELFTPLAFLIRITRPSKEEYQLSFYVKRKFDGIPDDTYVKQDAHTWLLPFEMLAPKLTELIETGILKEGQAGLTYIPAKVI